MGLESIKEKDGVFSRAKQTIFKAKLGVGLFLHVKIQLCTLMSNNLSFERV